MDFNIDADINGMEIKSDSDEKRENNRVKKKKIRRKKKKDY
jgi:hypothetical protein